MQIRTILLIVLLALLAGIISPIFAQSDGLKPVHAKFFVEGQMGRYIENIDGNIIGLTPGVTLFTTEKDPRFLLDVGFSYNWLESGVDRYARRQDATLTRVFMNLNIRPFKTTWLKNLTIHGGGGVEYADVNYADQTTREMRERIYFEKTSLVVNGGAKYVIGGQRGFELYIVGNLMYSDELQRGGSCSYAVRGTGGIGVRFW